MVCAANTLAAGIAVAASATKNSAPGATGRELRAPLGAWRSEVGQAGLLTRPAAGLPDAHRAAPGRSSPASHAEMPAARLRPIRCRGPGEVRGRTRSTEARLGYRNVICQAGFTKKMSSEADTREEANSHVICVGTGQPARGTAVMRHSREHPPETANGAVRCRIGPVPCGPAVLPGADLLRGDLVRAADPVGARRGQHGEVHGDRDHDGGDPDAPAARPSGSEPARSSSRPADLPWEFSSGLRTRAARPRTSRCASAATPRNAVKVVLNCSWNSLASSSVRPDSDAMMVSPGVCTRLPRTSRTAGTYVAATATAKPQPCFRGVARQRWITCSLGAILDWFPPLSIRIYMTRG